MKILEFLTGPCKFLTYRLAKQLVTMHFYDVICVFVRTSVVKHEGFEAGPCATIVFYDAFCVGS